MGAWGLGVFENDSAWDWLDELLESEGSGMITGALSEVLAPNDYMDVDVGSAGLAAIELINLLNNRGPEDVPEHITEWADKNRDIDVSGLLVKAREALGKIDNEETSEVAGLWLEADQDWKGMIADIRSRLGQ